jgi:hypothetical protein
VQRKSFPVVHAGNPPKVKALASPRQRSPTWHPLNLKLDGHSARKLYALGIDLAILVGKQRSDRFSGVVGLTDTTECRHLRDTFFQLRIIADHSGLVGTTFTPGFLLTAIMALATAWTATNPFGPSLDPDAAKMPNHAIKPIFALRKLRK